MDAPQKVLQHIAKQLVISRADEVIGRALHANVRVELIPKGVRFHFIWQYPKADNYHVELPESELVSETAGGYYPRAKRCNIIRQVIDAALKYKGVVP